MRHDYYHLYTFDTYVYLIADRYDDEEKRRYIASRLAQVDWIVIDDTYVQWYQHLARRQSRGNAVVAQHYRDLFDGKLGFELVQTFKVYPALSRWRIIDDAAEFTFRLFDHPTIFIFKRVPPAGWSQLCHFGPPRRVTLRKPSRGEEPSQRRARRGPSTQGGR